MKQRFLLPMLVLSFSVSLVPVRSAEPTPAERAAWEKDFYERVLQSARNFQKRLLKDGVAQPWPTLGVRQVVDNLYQVGMAAKYYKKSGTRHSSVDIREALDALTAVLKQAEAMQDLDKDSRFYGNFRWYWRTPTVTDQNAVEFVVTHALPVWSDAREELPAESREILERLLRRSVDGCIGHIVRSDYTNIALFNIVHLLALGEHFERPDAIEEGRKRLRSILVHLHDHGAYEYVSPTYYAVNIEALLFGFQYVRDPEAKATIKTLLDYFWTDLALNWYTPAQRLSGSQSRTYHYLLGVAGVNRFFEYVGLASPVERVGDLTLIGLFDSEYEPPREILALSEIYPRLIEQRWGPAPTQRRTTYITRELALGTSAANYGRAMQDMVLTVDLADYKEIPKKKPEKYLPRNYFIADGREDPYGLSKYPTSTAGHAKALHIDAWWTAAQDKHDAIGVVYYPPKCLEPNIHTNIQSHFVFRIPDAVYVDGKPVVLAAPEDKKQKDAENKDTKTGPPVVVEVGDRPVVLRYGSRAVGIRIPWGVKQTGATSEVRLVNDGNPHGVWRLSVEQWDKNAPPAATPLQADLKQRMSMVESPGLELVVPKEPTIKLETMSVLPGAAIWVRTGERLNDDKAFQQFAADFGAAKIVKSQFEKERFRFVVAGSNGSVGIDGNDPLANQRLVRTVPDGAPGILRCNGREYGRPLLEKTPLLADFMKRKAEAVPIGIDGKNVRWEAESGVGLMTGFIEEAENASGGKAVRVNQEHVWELDIARAGTYYLWSRVLTTDPEHDSLFAEWHRLDDQQYPISVRRDDWHLSVAKDKGWHWERLVTNRNRERVGMELSPGRWRLTLSPREFDVLVDALFLTTDPKVDPGKTEKSVKKH